MLFVQQKAEGFLVPQEIEDMECNIASDGADY